MIDRYALRINDVMEDVKGLIKDGVSATKLKKLILGTYVNTRSIEGKITRDFVIHIRVPKAERVQRSNLIAKFSAVDGNYPQVVWMHCSKGNIGDICLTQIDSELTDRLIYHDIINNIYVDGEIIGLFMNASLNRIKGFQGIRESLDESKWERLISENV